jgi:hypothetical protein
VAATRETQGTSTEDRVKAIRELAEGDLVHFIRLVAPKQVLGAVHEEVCRWWTRQERKQFQLLLLPRDHGKSRLLAFRVAWWITKHPEVRILYLSATSNLAEKQLKFIKDILTSPIYRKYWPEMVNVDENKRERWTNTEIAVDHPKRKEEGIRDPTVFIGGLTTTVTGLHCDIACLDDIVIGDNAYTEEGRSSVKTQYSYLSSIEGADGEEWVVGTRYHPKDLYNDMMEMAYELYDEDGYESGEVEYVYEKFERQVEDAGDGTGEFLWPRQQRTDGVWFGFDRRVLAIKRAKYLDRTQFRAQYYNDPNDDGDARIGRDKFQYYDKQFLTSAGGKWFYKDQRLNVFAAIDFAYSTSRRSDYTALVVIGIDCDHNIYVLDIDRFKSERIKDYFESILAQHSKWEFHRLAAETTAAQVAIVEELKDSYIKPYGLYLSVVPVKHTKAQGSKEERMTSILEPKYDNRAVWHYKGGNCQVLEDELIASHPPHDDVMDALATAISIAVPPSGRQSRDRSENTNVVYNTRFGGVSFNARR